MNVSITKSNRNRATLHPPSVSPGMQAWHQPRHCWAPPPRCPATGWGRRERWQIAWRAAGPARACAGLCCCRPKSRRSETWCRPASPGSGEPLRLQGGHVALMSTHFRAICKIPIYSLLWHKKTSQVNDADEILGRLDFLAFHSKLFAFLNAFCDHCICLNSLLSVEKQSSGW